MGEEMTVLSVVTWNVGKAKTIAPGILGTYAVAMQEMSDQKGLKTTMLEADYQMLDGTGKLGQAATPLFYRPRRLDLIRLIEEFLLELQFLG